MPISALKHILPTPQNGQYLTHAHGHITRQRAKKVVSDSPGLVDFAIGLEQFKLQKNCEIISAHQNVFGAS